MDITKKVKTLNLARKRVHPNQAKKRILPKKWQSTPSVGHTFFSSRRPRRRRPKCVRSLLDEAQDRHEVQLNALDDEYKRNGDSENVAHLKAQNALLPL